MNHRKTFLLSCCVLLCLCGCQKQAASDAAPSQDIETIFQELSPKISFEDTMEIVSDDYSEMLLSISPELYRDCILYMGSGATAEELLIFQTDSKEKCEQITAGLQNHLEEQKAAFEGYDPEELKILSESYLASSKTLVFLLVSQDTGSAKPYIDEYLK